MSIRCSECSKELTIDEEFAMTKKKMGMCNKCCKNYGILQQ